MDLGPASTRPGAIWATLAREAQTKPIGLVRFPASLSDILAGCKGRLCYLASPFSKLATLPDGSLNHGEAEIAARLAEWQVLRLADHGITAISPISASWRAVQAQPNLIDPLNAVFWETWCRPLLMVAYAVIVPPIRGWSESRGVAAEALFAAKNNVPLFVMGELPCV